jgi:hypothetical protein
MEDPEFENNIKEAFFRLEQKQLKQRLVALDNERFEADITDAFLLKEQNDLKKRLSGLNKDNTTEDVPPPTSIIPLWVRYSAASCLLIGIGIFLFQQNSIPQEHLANTIEKPKENNAIDKPKENIAINKSIDKQSIPSIKPNEISPVELLIKSNDFGLINKPLKYSNIIKSGATQLKYTFENNRLIVHSNKTFLIKSVKSFNNQLYINANGNYYLIEETVSKKSLIKNNDVNFETELNKIL